MKSSENNGPMYLVEGAKISELKVNTSTEVAGLSLTETTTGRIHTSVPSDHSATFPMKISKHLISSLRPIQGFFNMKLDSLVEMK